ncbi:MAG: J domain-containing protein [Erythrobacter sp.]|jgi:hypothetical protein|nr:J domain-containing protein [Erythrobacter sp.]
MFKIAVILLLFCLLFRWALGSWPWQMLRADTRRGTGRGLTPAQRLEAARALLGVKEAASGEEIRTAHKRLVSRVHPDRGGTAAEFQAANDARDLLLAQRGNKRVGGDRES